MKKSVSGILVWVLALLLLAFLYGELSGYAGSSAPLPFSEFLNYLDAGKISSVIIRPGEGNVFEGTLTDGSKFYTSGITYDGLVNELRHNNVNFSVENGLTFLGLASNLLLSWFPMLLLIGVWIFFMKKVHAGGNRAMSFGKSHAKLVTSKNNRVTLKDVAGIDEAKDELAEIVDFLKTPLKFASLGAKIPKGCLLIGPPGTGKTLLAKAIAGEAHVPFFSISGSDFVEMFVGVGASRVRDMFDQGKKNAPCLIFIDEIDAVGRHRGIGMGGGNDEREQTLNQLLIEMDGFSSTEGVIIIAATNRPDVLDHALLRPGRFDRRIVISFPDIKGREEILTVHIKKIPLAPDVNIRTIARGTPGFTGAELANLANEAALLAARTNRIMVTKADFEQARDKVMMGSERKSMIMREEEKQLTAFHEAGHAIVALNTVASDPIHKATIIPRGRSLGLVMMLPEHDRISLTFEKIISDITCAMGGRCAEEIIFGEAKVTSGAESDIQQATALANSMVTVWGMSKKLGPVLYKTKDKNNLSETLYVSDDKKNLIDDEVQRIIEECYNEAKRILNEKIDLLHLLSSALLQYETLTGDEIKELFLNGSIDRSNDEQNQEPISSLD